MKTVHRSSKQFAIPRYEENAALQLVAFTGVTFIMFHFARVLLLVFGNDKNDVFMMVYPNIGLATIEVFKHKAWTILSYGLAHHGFWDWITNMIWAYCFASILQTLTSYKQVIPLFIYGLLAGGIFYLSGQMINADFFAPAEGQYILGAYAGIMTLAITSLVLAPNSKLYLGEHFAIPVYLIVLVYVVLTFISYFSDTRSILLLSAGGAVTGVIFALLLKSGYQPSVWIYNIIDSAEKIVTPKDNDISIRKEAARRKELLRDYYTPTNEISQERIDELLDKINEKGYYSLSKEEKEILKKAGK